MVVADLKLSKLPDRTPVKLTIAVAPSLAADLALYADAYEVAYGRREAVIDLIPFMLESFLSSDRSFQRLHKK